MPDLIVSRVVVIGEKRVTGHQHARSAVTALQSMLLEESILQRVKLAFLLETFNGRYRTSVGLNGKRSARLDRASVHHNRASAAVTRVAADVCAG